MKQHLNENWKEILDRLSRIREKEDFSSGNVEFIRENLQAQDDRIRAAAALTARGCIFEPYVLGLLLDLSENDGVAAIRKASIQSLGDVIHEGVMRNYEDEIGSDTDIEYYEEWDEIQSETLQDDYRHVKELLISILMNEFEDQGVREASLIALSDLGFMEPVQETIREFIDIDHEEAKLAALHAMGKYPHLWIEELSRHLNPELNKPILMEAISSSYSSESEELADKIEKLLALNDPDIISYGLLTLAKINKTENLGATLQHFTHSENKYISESAREALITYTKANFLNYLEDEFGLEE